MQFYAINNRLPLKTLLFLALVLFIAYLPVSSFLFFLKNDAFTGYFPPKFFMSESLHAGQLPLWNPYINFGIPQYGDMSGGYWSPITWLIAGTVGYNAYSFTLEVLLYLLIGGIGMYMLTSFYQLKKEVCFIAAVAFMCCGYNVGHLQHFNWLSGAAFLPWCMWSYQRMLNDPGLKRIVQTVLCLYMLVASAHPGISISTAYLLGALAIHHFVNQRTSPNLSARLKQAGFNHLLLLLFFVLLGAGMIVGYLDILPHFARGEKIALADSLLHPATPQSWISVLLPFATVKGDAFFNTDVSMRNSYFSCTLLLFFIAALFSKKTALQRFLLLAGLPFLLLSFGGIFKTVAYKMIPLIGYVRLNGEFRVFAIFCFILFAAIELNKYFSAANSFTGTIKRVYYAVEIIVVGLIIFGLIKALADKESILFQLREVAAAPGMAGKLKAAIDAVSSYDTIWMQGMVQLLVLWGIKWCLRFGNIRLLQRIVVADIILASLFNIPFTGVGKNSVADVQQIINRSPQGFPIPRLIPINQYDTLGSGEKAMVGDWSFYNKQPGTVRQVLYPIVLKNTAAYFDRQELNPTLSVASRPLLFNAEMINDSTFIHMIGTFDVEEPAPVLKQYQPATIRVEAKRYKASNLVLLQNYYPHWYYSNGTQKLPVEKAGINFMKAPIREGVNTITFSFEPAAVRIGMLVSLVSMVALLLLLTLLPDRRK